MKDQIITLAMHTGYFKAKADSKRNEILDLLIADENLQEFTPEQINEVLQKETKRRSDAYQVKVNNQVKKALADSIKPLASGQDSAFEHISKIDTNKKVFILTVAQNNTDVDLPFLGALENYAKIHNAQILCAKMTYNKSGFQTSLDDADGIYYDSKIAKYLVNGHIALTNNLHFIADANVMPTAKQPLAGFEMITGAGVSAIIPSSKIALKCLARLKGHDAKVLFGTGAITKRNYILRKAGAVASSSHNIGALVVYVNDDGTYTARQLERMEGSDGFYDLNYHYTANTNNLVSPVALQLGDIHAEKSEYQIIQDVKKLISNLDPHNVILHDLCDFSSRNHHNIKSSSFVFEQTVNGRTVKDDLDSVAGVLAEIAAVSDQVYIIESNHDCAIDTWLENTDFKADTINALTYLTLMKAKFEHIEETSCNNLNMLEYALENLCEGVDDNVQFMRVDDSLIMAGVEMGVHGHIGVNGARGGVQSFAGLGIPMNTGHTHTPSIVGNVYTAGVTGSLDMGYNKGASSWQLAHVLTHNNGQRQIIFM